MDMDAREPKGGCVIVVFSRGQTRQERPKHTKKRLHCNQPLPIVPLLLFSVLHGWNIIFSILSNALEEGLAPREENIRSSRLNEGSVVFLQRFHHPTKSVLERRGFALFLYASGLPTQG